jgi:hypothetical protein
VIRRGAFVAGAQETVALQADGVYRDPNRAIDPTLVQTVTSSFG